MTDLARKWTKVDMGIRVGRLGPPAHYNPTPKFGLRVERSLTLQEIYDRMPWLDRVAFVGASDPPLFGALDVSILRRRELREDDYIVFANDRQSTAIVDDVSDDVVRSTSSWTFRRSSYVPGGRAVVMFNNGRCYILASRELSPEEQAAAFAEFIEHRKAKGLSYPGEPSSGPPLSEVWFVQDGIITGKITNLGVDNAGD